MLCVGHGCVGRDVACAAGIRVHKVLVDARKPYGIPSALKGKLFGSLRLLRVLRLVISHAVPRQQNQCLQSIYSFSVFKMVQPTRPPANSFVKAARRVYNPLGFTRGYNFICCISSPTANP